MKTAHWTRETLNEDFEVSTMHDYVIKWKHFPRDWPFVRRIHRWPVNSAHKGQWRGVLMFSLIFTGTNTYVNNSKAGVWDAIAPLWRHCNVIDARAFTATRWYRSVNAVIIVECLIFVGVNKPSNIFPFFIYCLASPIYTDSLIIWIDEAAQFGPLSSFSLNRRSSEDRVLTLIITLPANRDIYTSIYNICIIYRYDNYRSWPNCKAINPYRAGTELFRFNIANDIVADALAPCVARTSSPMMHGVDYVEEVHDDVIKWKHFPRYWPFVRGIHRSPGEFPSQRPVTRSFDICFDLSLNKRLSKQ